MHLHRLANFVQDTESVLDTQEYADAYSDMMARYQRETGNNTILPEHVDACLKLAAATCLDKLAAHYANDSQSTISSDSVEHGSKSDYYRRIANGYRAQYKEVVVSINKSTAHGKSILLPKRQRLR